MNASTPHSDAVWCAFVDNGIATCEALESHIADVMRADWSLATPRSSLLEMAAQCFTISYQASLLGVTEISALALTCEDRLAYLADNALPPSPTVELIASAFATMQRAFVELATPDSSGARIDQAPLAAVAFELRSLEPSVAANIVPTSSLVRKPASSSDNPDSSDAPDSSNDEVKAAPAQPLATQANHAQSKTAAANDTTTEPADNTAAVWDPAVSDDMVELFIDEARERLEDVSVKLIEAEQDGAGASEAIRDIFRDLHTIKGSAAMVALQPAKDVAHAAEDLVGQLRAGTRNVDAGVVNALLAAVDLLREIIDAAENRTLAPLDLRTVLARLRDPSAAPIKVPTATTSSSKDKTVSSTIRVDFTRLDRLLNLVGELVLEREALHDSSAALASISRELRGEQPLHLRWRSKAAVRAPAIPAPIKRELERVERVLAEINNDLDDTTAKIDATSSALRDSVMNLRMVSIGGILRKHQRAVRDLAHSLGKNVHLQVHGEDTELDKLLVEALDEPLLHLVRNAVDHGVELPTIRRERGKPEQAQIGLRARHQGNQVVIEVRDDGNGIDPDVMRNRAAERGLLTADELAQLSDRDALQIIFQPGFSTATQISEVSGRGVGMDIVRETIVDELKGTIAIESTLGQGTTFKLHLPLTLAIIQVLLARVSGQVVAIPLDNVVRTFRCPESAIASVQGNDTVFTEGEHLPLFRLARVLELPYVTRGPDETGQIVVVSTGGKDYALHCEHLAGKKETVIKHLGPLIARAPCVAGATLIGDRCVVILDIPQIVARAVRTPSASLPAQATTRASTEHESGHRVLIVEDSEVVRESIKRLLTAAGFVCDVAIDGEDGLQQAETNDYDLITTDVVMPRIDGYEFTQRVRRLREYQDTPIIMVTSREDKIDRVRGFDAGVDAYITKPHDRQTLLKHVRELLRKHPRSLSQSDTPPSPDRGEP